jgi:hypothetical protein
MVLASMAGKCQGVKDCLKPPTCGITEKVRRKDGSRKQRTIRVCVDSEGKVAKAFLKAAAEAHGQRATKTLL